MRKIGVAAFYDSGLTKVSLNKKILEIKEYAFDETEIESIKFPSGLRKVEIGTIPVEKLTIPETLGEISVENDDYDTGEGSLNVDNVRNEKTHRSNPFLHSNSIMHRRLQGSKCGRDGN